MSPYLRSMATAVTYIEDHLQDNINLADIAAYVAYSLFHFCRVFNQTVHHPPYDYLRRRRLTAAALQLLQTEQRVTDIAFAYQFATPDGSPRRRSAWSRRRRPRRRCWRPRPRPAGDPARRQRRRTRTTASSRAADCPSGPTA